MDHQTKERIARTVALGYARSYRIDRDDLEQEAWIAILKAEVSWRPGETPVEAYCYRAAVLRCWSSVRRALSPVSASNRGVKALEDVLCVDQAEVPREHQVDCGDLVGVVHHRRMYERIKGLLLEDDTLGGLAVEVLLDGREPADVALSNEVPADLVYYATARGKKRVAGDARIRRMWNER